MFNQAELLKYPTETDFYTMSMMVVMNKRKYDSLPDDIKKVIDETTGMVMSQEAGRVYDTMIFLIIIGANIFSTFLGLARLPMGLADFVTGLALPKMVILSGIIIIFIILGCVMDCYAIMILTVPIIFPVIEAIQFDPIWFGVLIVIVLEIGLITPPVGLNVFVLKSAAPDVPLTVIFRGIWPFLLAALFAIVLLIVFPQIALFLPSLM